RGMLRKFSPLFAIRIFRRTQAMLFHERMDQMKAKLIDWHTFIGALILILGVSIPLILFPETGAAVVEVANTFMTDTFGVLYLLVGLAAFAFLMFVAFSKNGHVKLGSEHEEKEFGTVSWA